jgi:hypothetical protein
VGASAAAVVGAAAAVGAVEDGAAPPPHAANKTVTKQTSKNRLIFLNVSTRFMANSPLVQTKSSTALGRYIDPLKYGSMAAVLQKINSQFTR